MQTSVQLVHLLSVFLFLLLSSHCSTDSSQWPPSIIWNPANSTNYLSANRGVGDIKFIIIHTTQETYHDTIALFKKYGYLAAHYVINNHKSPWASDKLEADGEITQMVLDKDIGYHVKGVNPITIGIEHVALLNMTNKLEVVGGFSFPMMKNSAWLTAMLCNKYQLPASRGVILGHDENRKINGTSTHLDPGPNWDWQLYMSLVTYYYSNNLVCDWPDITTMEKGVTTRVVQMLLRMRGYEQTPLTGVFDNQTKQSLSSFLQAMSTQTTYPANQIVWHLLLYGSTEDLKLVLPFSSTDSIYVDSVLQPQLSAKTTSWHVVAFLLAWRFFEITPYKSYTSSQLETVLEKLFYENQVSYNTFTADKQQEHLVLEGDAWLFLLSGCAASPAVDPVSKFFNLSETNWTLNWVLTAAIGFGVVLSVVLGTLIAAFLVYCMYPQDKMEEKTRKRRSKVKSKLIGGILEQSLKEIDEAV